LKDHLPDPFDVVHGFWAIPCGVAAVLLGRKLHRPSVVTFMGGETASLPEIGYGNMASFPAKRVTLWTSRNANELVTLSRFQVEELRLAASPGNGPHVFPFGVDHRLFPFREKDISARPLQLLHVSNINPLKDQATLLRAFQIISRSLDAQLRIVGEDQCDGAMRRLAGKLGVSERVEFVGTVSHDHMPLEYDRAHMLVHTSMHEAGVLVAAEAAASGVLVAGTRTGLIADFAPTRALACEVGDFRALAASIIEIAHQPGRYNAMRLAAHAWALEHNTRWTTGRYLELYEYCTTHYPHRLK
jgi:glycosyltransferase involved in cell wall biosynthesis